MQRTVVPQTSMEDFAGIVVKLEDSNHSDFCKPINKKHPTYKKLVEFIWDLLYVKTTDIQYEMVSISSGLMKMKRWQKEAHPDPVVDLAIASKKRSPNIFLSASDPQTNFVEQLLVDLERAKQSPLVDKDLCGVPKRGKYTTYLHCYIRL